MAAAGQQKSTFYNIHIHTNILALPTPHFATLTNLQFPG